MNVNDICMLLSLLVGLSMAVPRHIIHFASKDHAEKREKSFKRTVVTGGYGQNTSAMDIISKINQAKKLKMLYEGDINLLNLKNPSKPTTFNSKRRLRKRAELQKRDTKRDRKYLWRTRVIPYVISKELEPYRGLLEKGMQHIQEKSCVKFKRRDTEKNWLYFVKKDGCWSAVGKIFWREGPQEISIGDGCFITGTIVHEILHSLGFWHEQSRPDRDKYVEIFWENIEEGQEYNFHKTDNGAANTLGVQYDPTSVMHYGKYAFSKNNKPTMEATGNKELKLGQLNGMSALDILQLNVLYDCAAFKAGEHWSSWSKYGPCSDYCYKERQRFCSSSNPKHCIGANQFGVQTQFAKCKEDKTECYAPVNGHWGRWSSWGSCSSSCGVGHRTRKRVCNDPEPKHNGEPCFGKRHEVQSCRMPSCSLGPYDCKFESTVRPFCGWGNMASNSGNFYWILHKGATPSGGTGPRQDHTSGTGHYIYVEASAPAEPGNRAHLASLILDRKTPQCLRFFYHMYGASTGALRVYTLNIVTEKVKLIWHKAENQGQEWKKAEVSVNENVPFRLIFEAVRGSGYTSDIALDDITVINSSCTDKNTLGSTKATDQFTPTPSAKPTMEPEPVKVGCFQDKGKVEGKRPFPAYVDYRSNIDWGNIDRTVKQCAEKAKKIGVKLFAIEFYGECWYGKDNEVNYSRDGPSSNCWNSVGKENAMMVYKLS